MKLYILITTFIILHVSAKIHGGPRGRFDKQNKRKPAVHHVSARHTHFSYHPPSKINFMCRHCKTMTSYPVYHGVLPTYVYKFRESNSRFGYLLAGLALYNLGRATADSSQNSHYYTQHQDEQCSLQVIDDYKHFEESTFPCFMMSTFLEKAQKEPADSLNTFDITNSQINMKKLPTSSPFEVTRYQECVIWHNTTFKKENNIVPCSLLKEYSNTMKPAGVPVYVWLPVTVGIVLVLSICCQCCFKKKKVEKEEAPLNDGAIVGYCSNYYQ